MANFRLLLTPTREKNILVGDLEPGRKLSLDITSADRLPLCFPIVYLCAGLAKWCFIIVSGVVVVVVSVYLIRTRPPYFFGRGRGLFRLGK